MGDRSGFVLVAVLSVTALLALLTGGGVLLSRGAVETASVGDETLRAQALLRSGVELAGHQLFVLRVDPATLNGQQLRLDTGTVTIFAASEAGRVDLNGADAVLLAAAYRASGLSTLSPTDFAERVVDRRGGGGGTSFRLVADLGEVPGVSSGDVAALAPFLTVYNPAGRIDPMFAPIALLQALPGVPEGIGPSLTDARGRGGLDRLFHLRAIFRGLESYLVLGEALRVFRVRVEAQGAAGGRVTRVEAVLIASVVSDRPFQITDWRALP